MKENERRSLGRRSWVQGTGAMVLASACGASWSNRPDNHVHDVGQLADALTANLESPVDRAMAVFAFVRDEIDFGFTPGFDQASPEETLALRRGHCNPQAALFRALLSHANIPSRQHFVTIDNTIIVDLFPTGRTPPPQITHSYVEVRLDGRWIRVDGYIADPPFHLGACERLRASRRQVGFGVHLGGSIEWDGMHDCMSQLADETMVVADHGCRDPSEFYRSRDYQNGSGLVGRFLYRRFVVGEVNASISALRASAT